MPAKNSHETIQQTQAKNRDARSQKDPGVYPRQKNREKTCPNSGL
jgi:hypothetical protein